MLKTPRFGDHVDRVKNREKEEKRKKKFVSIF